MNSGERFRIEGLSVQSSENTYLEKDPNAFIIVLEINPIHLTFFEGHCVMERARLVTFVVIIKEVY